MATNDNPETPRPKWLDNVGAFVLCSVTVAFMVVTIGPYFGLQTGSSVDAVTANQNAVVNNLFIAIVSFFVGASVSNRKKDEAIATQSATIQAAQAALAPVTGAPDKTVPLKAGETVAVKADDPKPGA